MDGEGVTDGGSDGVIETDGVMDGVIEGVVDTEGEGDGPGTSTKVQLQL